MIGYLMVALMWAAAAYRVVLSVRSETTMWRTAFTACAVGVALATTTETFGDQMIDAWSGVWNLSLLLTRVLLTGAAVAASIYVATLKRPTVTPSTISLRLTVGGLLVAVQTAAWLAAPIHSRELATTAEVDGSSFSGMVFVVTFASAVVWAMVEVAQFCFSRARGHTDLPRTISLTLSGSACAAGALLFVAGVGAFLARQFLGVDTQVVSQTVNSVLPLVVVVLALGTLSLLIAPPALDVARQLRRWWWLRPLWHDLIRRRPEVHLDVPRTGGPRRRLQVRLHRVVVETHDALRLTPVSVPDEADLDDLARALHRVGGPATAAEVFGKVKTLDDNDLNQLLTLARTYSRTRP